LKTKMQGIHQQLAVILNRPHLLKVVLIPGLLKQTNLVQKKLKYGILKGISFLKRNSRFQQERIKSASLRSIEFKSLFIGEIR